MNGKFVTYVLVKKKIELKKIENKKQNEMKWNENYADDLCALSMVFTIFQASPGALMWADRHRQSRIEWAENAYDMN